MAVAPHGPAVLSFTCRICIFRCAVAQMSKQHRKPAVFDVGGAGYRVFFALWTALIHVGALLHIHMPSMLSQLIWLSGSFRKVLRCSKQRGGTSFPAGNKLPDLQQSSEPSADQEHGWECSYSASECTRTRGCVQQV